MELFYSCLPVLCENPDIEEAKIPSNHPLFKEKALRQMVSGTKFYKIKANDLQSINLDTESSSFASVILSNETIYKGELRNGKAHDPNAIIIFSDGSYYKGSVERGVISGKGAYKFADEKYSYCGSWFQGVPQGKGLEISPSGTYEGNFRSGVKSGGGRLVFPDGSIYVGCFEHNNINGEGIFYSQKYFAQGIWINGFLQGMGKQKYADGSEYIGSFRKGKPDGIGRFMLPNRRIYVGNFHNGKPVGKGMFIQNDKKYQINLKDEDMNSLSVSLYSLLTRHDEKLSLSEFQSKCSFSKMSKVSRIQHANKQ